MVILPSSWVLLHMSSRTTTSGGDVIAVAQIVHNRITSMAGLLIVQPNPAPKGTEAAVGMALLPCEGPQAALL